jgi:hypothetical protein
MEGAAVENKRRRERFVFWGGETFCTLVRAPATPAQGVPALCGSSEDSDSFAPHFNPHLVCSQREQSRISIAEEKQRDLCSTCVSL